MGIIAKGLGGVEWEFDYPLTPLFADQVKSGQLKILRMTGEDARPDSTAAREEWVDYLVRIHGIDASDTKGISKPDLMEWADDLDEKAGRLT